MSRQSLEQITLFASHDLQEPLRKNELFSGRLLFNIIHDEEMDVVLSRIDFAFA